MPKTQIQISPQETKEHRFKLPKRRESTSAILSLHRHVVAQTITVAKRLSFLLNSFIFHLSDVPIVCENNPRLIAVLVSRQTALNERMQAFNCATVIFGSTSAANCASSHDCSMTLVFVRLRSVSKPRFLHARSPASARYSN